TTRLMPCTSLTMRMATRTASSAQQVHPVQPGKAVVERHRAFAARRRADDVDQAVHEIAFGRRDRVPDGRFVFEFQIGHIQKRFHDEGQLVAPHTISSLQNPDELRECRRRNECGFVRRYQIVEEALRELPLLRAIAYRKSQQNVRVDCDHLMDRSNLSTAAWAIASFISSMLTGGPSYLMNP